MKRISKLLVACMLHSAAFALGTFEQKTFLLPHNPVHTQLLEQTMWRTHRHNPALMQDGHVQVTGFYGESMNRASLGRYFGIGNGKNSFQVGAGNDNDTDLDGGYLIHDQANAAASTLAGKVTLNPRQTIYGANISYRQSMTGPFAGVFFQASMPIVQVANNLGLTIENPTDVVLGIQHYSLADYFAGTVNVEAGANAQAPLNKGKMVMGERRATGLADISLQLGYKLICNEDTHLDVSLRGIVPTGNQSTGDYLFEPLVGNNNHFGIGAGIDADATLWHKDGHRLSLQGGAQYTYVLEANEMRMAAIQRRTDDGFKYNQYVAVAAPGAPLDLAKQPVLAPAANGLAQQFSVRPGSQLELLTGLGFHSGGLSVNVGYNLNWREQEQVYRKAKDAFAENYVVVGRGATLNARVPAAAPAPFVGVVNATQAGTLFTAAIDTNGATIALAQPAAILAGVAADGIGIGTNAGAGRLAGAQLAAYQGGAQLFAATGFDSLQAADAVAAAAANAAITAAGADPLVAVPGAAGAVAVATAARNQIQSLQRANVSYTDSIRQESMITHVLGGSIGYSFEAQPGFPVMLGLGGQYELPHSTNAGLESYKLFCKLGISF